MELLRASDEAWTLQKEEGTGPRKFILRLIFTRLFNLSLRPFVKLLCCGSFPATGAWEGGRESFPEIQWGGSAGDTKPEVPGPPGQLPGHVGVHPQRSSRGPEISASVVVALLPRWPQC